MVFIRTDANENVATGHVMRCCTIAKKIRELGEEVTFLFRDSTSIDVLGGREKYILLENVKGDIKAELSQIVAILQAEEDVKLLLDLYEFDAWYMEQLKPYAKIITFDDMFQEKFPADIIINYNLYFTKFDYAFRYEGKKTKLLLGGEYVPLRDEFIIEEAEEKETVSTVLLICGGGDKYHVLVDMVKRILTREMQKRYHFIVIAGILNNDIEELRRLADELENVTVYDNVGNMAEIMKEVDIVVSAASTVLYECCSLRKVTIFFTVAENQKYDVEVFSIDDMMRYAGDVRGNKEKVIDIALDEVEKITCRTDDRKSMIERMRNTIDGRGAERIAREIVNASSN